MTILNVTETTGLLWLMFVGVGLIVLGMILLIVYSMTTEISDVFGSIAATVQLIGVIVLIISCFIPNGKYRYEVLLDKNVSVTEFYEDWKVIEQRGDIWVIEEKYE